MPSARALNRPLPADGSVPDWIELLPAGPEIVGVDGRRWTLESPEPLLAAFAARNTPLVILGDRLDGEAVNIPLLEIDL